MPTPAEQKALLFLGAVAVLGGGLRLLRAEDPTRPDPAAEQALAAQVAATDSAAAAVRAQKAAGSRRKKPKGRDADSGGTRVTIRPPVDLDRATAEEIDALPGVGPSLARKIVADRDVRGPFGSLAALDQVSGVGPSMLARLQPHVTFSAPPRPSTAVLPGPTGPGSRPSGRVVGLIGGIP